MLCNDINKIIKHKKNKKKKQKKKQFHPKWSKLFSIRADPFSEREETFSTEVPPLKEYSLLLSTYVVFH